MQVIIYTDGSAWPNPGPGGWAAIIDGQEIFGSEALTTNNRMELTAVIRSLQHVPKNSALKIHSDSQYVVNGVGCWENGKPTKNGWMVKWKKQGWKLFEGEVKNVDLWQELYELVKLYDSVEMVWVRGHNNDSLNERCDKLALKARQMNVVGDL